MTKYQRKKLNGLLHEAVRVRDGSQCLWCKKQGVLHLSHIYPKGKYRKMEWELDNLKLLCTGCHLYKWHKSPVEAWEWLNATLPPERLQKLKEMAQKVNKTLLNDAYYNKMTTYLQDYVKKTDSKTKTSVSSAPKLQSRVRKIPLTKRS